MSEFIGPVTTELSHLDDLDTEMKSAAAAAEVIAAQLTALQSWAAGVGERYNAAPFATAALNDRMALLSDRLGALPQLAELPEVFHDVSAAVCSAKNLGEHIANHGAEGKTEAFAAG